MDSSSVLVTILRYVLLLLMILAMQLAKLDDCRRPQYCSSCAGSLDKGAVVVTRHDGVPTELSFLAILSRPAHLLKSLSS